MDQLVIRGGKALCGEVQVSGAKNAALPLMAAALLTAEPLRLSNVPRLMDVRTMTRLLRHLGTEVAGDGTADLTLQARQISRPEAPYDLVKTMRAAVVVLGPLVARYGRARVSLPGGCAIGPRPINLHLMGLEKLGATIRLDQGYVEAEAARLTGARIAFDIQTVTGTENLMMAATLAEGTTVLENAACEPEVTDLAALLNRMGGKIEGAGTQTITIRGVSALQGVSHRTIPDRIEAGTFAMAGAITGGTSRSADAARTIWTRSSPSWRRPAPGSRPGRTACGWSRAGGRRRSTCGRSRSRGSPRTCRRRSWPS